MNRPIDAAEAEVLNAYNTGTKHDQSITIVHGLLFKRYLIFDGQAGKYKITSKGIEALNAFIFSQKSDE